MADEQFGLDEFESLDGETFLDPVKPIVTEPDPELIAKKADKPKSRTASHNLVLSTTMKKPKYIPVPLTAPMEKGGGSCLNCGRLVCFDDYLGQSEGNVFTSVGYHCHWCSHRWVRPKHADEEKRNGQSFMTMSRWEIKREKMV